MIDAWQDGDFDLVVCPRLVYEVRKALLSPRSSRRYEISESDAEAFARKLAEEGVMKQDPESPPRVVPDDSKDDYLVALALESGILVTRDRHFEKVAVGGLQIMGPAGALRMFDG